jgi:hypothetical protein
MAVTTVLLLIGLAAALAAIHGLAGGTIYCKGGPYSRTTQPVAFWASVLVYLFWSGLMGYFAFFKAG